jgi:hypothetical protein
MRIHLSSSLSVFDMEKPLNFQFSILFSLGCWIPVELLFEFSKANKKKIHNPVCLKYKLIKYVFDLFYANLSSFSGNWHIQVVLTRILSVSTVPIRVRTEHILYYIRCIMRLIISRM